MNLEDQLVGTPYRAEHRDEGWVLVERGRVVDGPYPYWTQAWIAAMERASCCPLVVTRSREIRADRAPAA